MDLYAFGFERSVAHPLGLWAHEVTRFSLGELRRLFGAACHDARERRANGDRDIPRTMNGAVAGIVSVVEVGIRIEPDRGPPTYITWTEVFGGLSLAAIRELLAVAHDARGRFRIEPLPPTVHVYDTDMATAA